MSPNQEHEVEITIRLSKDLVERLAAYSDYKDEEKDSILQSWIDERLKQEEVDQGLVGFKEFSYTYSQVEEPGAESLPLRD